MAGNDTIALPTSLTQLLSPNVDQVDANFELAGLAAISPKLSLHTCRRIANRPWLCRRASYLQAKVGAVRAALRQDDRASVHLCRATRAPLPRICHASGSCCHRRRAAHAAAVSLPSSERRSVIPVDRLSNARQRADLSVKLTV
jgi:hypothetical protein